jgi:hypothetical protein
MMATSSMMYFPDIEDEDVFGILPARALSNEVFPDPVYRQFSIELVREFS